MAAKRSLPRPRSLAERRKARVKKAKQATPKQRAAARSSAEARFRGGR